MSPDDTEIRDSQDTFTILKSADDSISIERTRKDKFRHALRSVSKVAFSQLGLGKFNYLFFFFFKITNALFCRLYR